MRVSLKTDYALRAVLELSASDPEQPLVKGERIADAQGIPQQFLEHILLDLKRAGLIRARRGAKGGYMLAKTPEEISVADVIRAVEGPLANIHESAPEEIHYRGAAASLREVWVAVRASLRGVLENTSIADVRDGSLPWQIEAALNDPEAWTQR